MKKEKEVNKSGFTLIEILIVVLIIGLLTAIAVPGYRKAVEKSKVADALTTMQAVAKSEHGFYLAKNTYTKDFADLDIALIDKDGNKAEDASFETVNYTFTLQNNNIKAQRANGEYTLYKMYEDPNIYCLPQDHYICQQYDWGVNRTLCDNVINGAWSNRKGKCYNTQKERCEANNENGATWYNNNGGYCAVSCSNPLEVFEYQTCVYGTIATGSTFTGEGAKCSQGNACYGSYFRQGAKCIGVERYNGGCSDSTFSSGAVCYANYQYQCMNGTFNDGSKCIPKDSARACDSAIINDGGKCIADYKNCNYATYNGTGCCEGQYCNPGTPRCECDIVNGRHLTSCPEAQTAG